ncbi:MAG: hypothetical protein HY349_07895, partial [Nitrospirae bacterium]|nr:hypothetical protein [Nitrospirota bacterium]
LILSALLASASVGAGATVAAENPSEKASDRPIYRYVDPNGTEVFTDDLSRVPAERRSSATIVALPPAVKMPEPPPAPKPEPSSFSTRAREWFNGQPPAYRLILIGVLPVMVLSLWALSFFRRRSESLFAKLILRFGMVAILVLSAYLCYFIFIRGQAGKLIGAVPGGSDFISSPKQRAEDLKKDEADRLKTIEDIANQK